MIQCDIQIETLIKDGRLIVTPPPLPEQFNSTSLDLRVGDDFHVWKPSLSASGTRYHVDLDHVNLRDLEGLVDPLLPDANGMVVLPPSRLVLVRTLEQISMPREFKLAARVEGRSKQARIGLTAHITAPTIHAGFAGRITLELINHGPFWIEVRPNHTRLCQFIVEEVGDVPQRGGSTTFSQQQTPLG